MAWQAYWIGADEPSAAWGKIVERVGILRFVIVGLLLALVPAFFLSLSTTNSLLHPKTRLMFVSVPLIAGCCGFSYWLGGFDAATRQLQLDPWGIEMDYPLLAVIARSTHVVSWFSLAVPIIMTAVVMIVILQSSVCLRFAAMLPRSRMPSSG